MPHPSSRKAYWIALIILLFSVQYATAKGSAIVAAESMKKAIDLVGIKPFMTQLTIEEQQIYPKKKSAIETTLSSTYSEISNTKTFHIALSNDWRKLIAQKHSIETVDNQFARNFMRISYSKYLCSYPPTRLLMDKGITLSFQYIESDSTYLFTLSFTSEKCF